MKWKFPTFKIISGCTLNKKTYKLTNRQTQLSDVIVWAYYNAPQASQSCPSSFVFWGVAGTGGGLVKMTLGLV